MTTLHIDLRVLSGIDPETIPAVAEAWMRPHRAYHVEDGSEDYLLGTDILKVKLVDGKADVVLPPTPAGNALSIQLRRIKGFGQPFLVAIPASGTVNIGDLAHLDPSTLDPEAPLDPAWVAGLEAVQDELSGKVNASTYVAGMAGKADAAALTTTQTKVAALPTGLVAPDLINTYPWSYPYAVYDDTRKRVYVSGIGRDGQVGLAQFNLRSKVVERFNYAGVTPDDHNVPAILLDETAKALLVYTLHGEDDNLYVVNGSRPHALDPAISTRSTVAKATTSLGVTNYGQLIRRSSTAVVGMFRADLPSAGWHLVQSANNGVTWGASKRIHAKQYQMVRPNAAGTGFHMLIFDHTTQQSPMTCKYVFLNTATGALTGKNGVAVGNLWSDVDDPILSEAELATNGLVRSLSKSSGTSFRVHDISADGNYVLTTEFACATTPTNSVYEPDPATGQYVVLAWNGSSWARQPVVASGLPFGYYQSMYVAGGQFADNGATLYLGRESAGTWTVEKWTRSGSTWSLAKTLDTSTEYMVGRIQLPVGTEQYLTFGRYYAYNQGVGGFHTYMADQVVLPLT